MKRSAVRLAPVVLAVLVGAAVLSGCAPAAHAPHGHPHHTASGGSSSGSSAVPSATPTPTPTPFPQSLGPLPANALFRITAQGFQKNGAVVDLSETVYAPVAPTPADTTLLNTQCNTDGYSPWQSGFSGPALYVHATMTATIEAGAASFDTSTEIAAYFGYEVAAFTGAYHEAQAPCADGFVTVPGTMQGLSPVLASNPVHDQQGWGNSQTRYGFFGDALNSGPDVPGPTLVKNCAVDISAAALAAAPALSAWTTQPYVPANSCSYTP